MKVGSRRIAEHNPVERELRIRESVTIIADIRSRHNNITVDLGRMEKPIQVSLF